MTDPRITYLARILVQYSTEIQQGDRVAIIGEPPADPLIREVYREVLRAGGHPHLALRFEDMEYILFTEASEEQLNYISPFERLILEEFEAMISVRSQSNTRLLTNVDPTQQQIHAKARTDLYATYTARSATREFKWVGTLFPTQAYAQDAEMSLEEFEDYVYSTTYADSEDPIAAWLKVHDEQQRLVDWLAGKKHMEVKGPEVELTLSIEGRTFVNSDGKRNMPSGEIFTSPVEESVNGWVRYTYPAVLRGREVEGIELHFEDGKVVKASAKKNEGYLLKMLDTDPGARYLGEFAVGTNKKINRFIKNILFDEKIGGTIHTAVGYGFPEAGSKNKSAIHWDMICDMRDGGQITVDGELFYESGEFKI